MVGDIPGMQTAGGDSAANLARELETSINQGQDTRAYQRFSEEVQRYPGDRQAFVKGVLQQIAQDGYHLPEMQVVGQQALSQIGSSSEVGRGAQAQPSAGAGEVQAAPNEAPLRGPLPPQTIQSSELPPPPQTGRQALQGEQAQLPQDALAQVQGADRIVYGAVQLKQHGADNRKIENYVKKETEQIYKQHPEWMNASSPSSFIQELNQGFKQEHIWERPTVKHGVERGLHPGTSIERSPHAEAGVSKEWLKDFHKQEHTPFVVGEDGKYTVKRGDTVWTIARRALEHEHHDDRKYHPSNKEISAQTKQIIDANHLHNPKRITPNDKLIIPGIKAAPHEAAKPAPAPQHPSEAATPPAPGAEPPRPLVEDAKHQDLKAKKAIAEYTVGDGDKNLNPKAWISLESIAKELTPPADQNKPQQVQHTLDSLASLNNLKTDEFLHPGDKLWVPTAKYLKETSTAPTPGIPKPASPPETAAQKQAADNDTQLVNKAVALGKDATSSWSSMEHTYNGDIAQLRDTVKEADQDQKAGKANVAAQIETRQYLVKALVNNHPSSAEQLFGRMSRQESLDEAKKVVEEMQKIEPGVFSTPAWIKWFQKQVADGLDMKPPQSK